jgi:hypothetical protein
MLEGGGQILRMSAALSAITGLGVSVDRVRAKRAKPGLQVGARHAHKLTATIGDAAGLIIIISIIIVIIIISSGTHWGRSGPRPPRHVTPSAWPPS